MNDQRNDNKQKDRKVRGQSMVEYALILAILALSLGAAIAATGPVIGNIFSNTVYNLLRQTPEGAGRPVTGPVDWWLTVTYVHENPQDEQRLPTRTPAPPSTTPTAGPSPTATPVTPTRTPAPTATPRPSPTPLDITRVAPYLDTVDEPELWRTNFPAFLGYGDWCGQYYDSTDLTGTPTEICNADLGPQYRGVLNFDWGGGGPIAGWNTNYFSARWTREIYVDPIDNPSGMPVTFTVSADDGVRIKYYDSGSCVSGCTIVDDWNDQPMGSTPSVSYVLPPGVPGTTARLEVEYYEKSGGAGIIVDIKRPPNPDDVNTAGGSIDCNWGRQDTDNSNSQEWEWEEYVAGDFARNMRCYLEFRGYVFVPGILDQAEFVFWDVWDFGSNNQVAWVEVAEYIESSPGAADRAAMTWQQIPLPRSNTSNYNWTRNVIDLTNVSGTSYVGKRVAFRFVMQNGNDGSRRRWYIDDVEFRQGDPRDFTIGEQWTLDTPDQEPDFITSGRWELTGTRTFGSSGLAWEDSPGGNNYDENSESNSDNDLNDMRVHYLELNGWVDVSGALPDLEGDVGDPMISFYHAYDVGSYTGLELQYTTSPYGVGPANWQTVPGDGSVPFGRLVNSATSGTQTQQMEFEEVLLSEIPATRFRLRFALTVRGNANRRDGWYIDQIYIERQGRPQYLDYPFLDNAEAGLDNWLISGSWGRTQTTFKDGAHSFTDSPLGNYNPYDNTYLRFLYPIDLFNDTPDNLLLDDRNPAGGNSNPAAPGTIAPRAVDPIMVFWHRRLLNSNDDLYVEWRRWDESDSNWKPLWEYQYRMGTRSWESSTRTGQQTAWERVEVDMTSIMNQFIYGDGNLEDDDILIRFRLDADSNGSINDGVFIDSISIQERNERVFRLWPQSENRTISGTPIGNGSGARYNDDIDNFDWWDRWYTGGTWTAIEWEQRNGLRAFHDSPVGGQDRAPFTPVITYNAANSPPYGVSDIPLVPAPGSDSDAYLPEDTFNVLEMNTIIDLRATSITEEPTLYFWDRYHVGDNERISVEISYRLDARDGSIDSRMASWCGTGRPNCYEHEYGWSEWEEVWTRGEWSKGYGWMRDQVSLQSYASPNGTTLGRQIRIRFVNDGYDDPDQRDGWYIDDVYIGPREDGVIRTIASQSFFDNARNMSNWVAEGTWGLAPEVFRGSGGGPAALGTWTEYWWNCSSCEGLAPGGTTSRDRMLAGSDVFLDQRRTDPFFGSPAPVTRTVLDINYDMGYDAPRPGVFDYNNRIVGRWTLDTPVIGTGGVQQGDYTFITISDDGVRMKYEEIDGDGNPVNPAPPLDSLEWNIIYDWTDHGRTADMGIASLQDGKRYRITLEYYEKWSGAAIILTVGGTNFSFTDSPKQGAGPAFVDIPAIPYANTSLMLDGTLDLAGTTNPILEYYTYYEIRTAGRVEVSVDGGFTWEQGGMTDAIGSDTNFQWPSYSGRCVPGDCSLNDWRQMRHNLTRYVGRQIMIRFRLDRQTDNYLDQQYNNPFDSRFNNNGYFISWWVVDIRVADAN